METTHGRETIQFLNQKGLTEGKQVDPSIVDTFLQITTKFALKQKWLLQAGEKDAHGKLVITKKECLPAGAAVSEASLSCAI